MTGNMERGGFWGGSRRWCGLGIDLRTSEEKKSDLCPVKSFSPLVVGAPSADNVNIVQRSGLAGGGSGRKEEWINGGSEMLR